MCIPCYQGAIDVVSGLGAVCSSIVSRGSLQTVPITSSDDNLVTCEDIDTSDDDCCDECDGIPRNLLSKSCTPHSTIPSLVATASPQTNGRQCRTLRPCFADPASYEATLARLPWKRSLKYYFNASLQASPIARDVGITSLATDTCIDGDCDLNVPDTDDLKPLLNTPQAPPITPPTKITCTDEEDDLSTLSPRSQDTDTLSSWQPPWELASYENGQSLWCDNDEVTGLTPPTPPSTSSLILHDFCDNHQSVALQSADSLSPRQWETRLGVDGLTGGSACGKSVPTAVTMVTTNGHNDSTGHTCIHTSSSVVNHHHHNPLLPTQRPLKFLLSDPKINDISSVAKDYKDFKLGLWDSDSDDDEKGEGSCTTQVQ